MVRPRGSSLNKPLVCKHCGTEITNDLYIEKGAGIYACENCYFQDTYVDGITSQIETSYLATIEAFVTSLDAKEHEVGKIIVDTGQGA